MFSPWKQILKHFVLPGNFFFRVVFLFQATRIYVINNGKFIHEHDFGIFLHSMELENVSNEY